MCPRPQYTGLTYMEGTGPCGPMRIIFDNVIKSWYTSLNIKFGANRTLNVPQCTGLAYIGGTGPCGPMRLIFDSVIKSY